MSLLDWQDSLLAHKKRDKTMQRRMLQLKFMRQKLGQMTVTRSEGAASSRLGGSTPTSMTAWAFHLPQIHAFLHSTLLAAKRIHIENTPLSFYLLTFLRDTRSEGNLTSVHFAGKATQWTCLQAFVLLISISSLLLRTVYVSHSSSLTPWKSC